MSFRKTSFLQEDLQASGSFTGSFSGEASLVAIELPLGSLTIGESPNGIISLDSSGSGVTKVKMGSSGEIAGENSVFRIDGLGRELHLQTDEGAGQDVVIGTDPGGAATLRVANSIRTGDTSNPALLEGNTVLSGFSGVWLNKTSPSNLNYSLLGDSNNTFLNASGSGQLLLRVNNDTKLSIDNAGTFDFDGNSLTDADLQGTSVAWNPLLGVASGTALDDVEDKSRPFLFTLASDMPAGMDGGRGVGYHWFRGGDPQRFQLIINRQGRIWARGSQGGSGVFNDWNRFAVAEGHGENETIVGQWTFEDRIDIDRTDFPEVRLYDSGTLRGRFGVASTAGNIMQSSQEDAVVIGNDNGPLNLGAGGFVYARLDQSGNFELVGGDNYTYYKSANNTGGGVLMQSILHQSNSFDRGLLSHNIVYTPESNSFDFQAIGANDGAAIHFFNGSEIGFIIHPDTGNSFRSMSYDDYTSGMKMKVGINEVRTIVPLEVTGTLNVVGNGDFGIQSDHQIRVGANVDLSSRVNLLQVIDSSLTVDSHVIVGANDSNYSDWFYDHSRGTSVHLNFVSGTLVAYMSASNSTIAISPEGQTTQIGGNVNIRRATTAALNIGQDGLNGANLVYGANSLLITNTISGTPNTMVEFQETNIEFSQNVSIVSDLSVTGSINGTGELKVGTDASTTTGTQNAWDLDGTTYLNWNGASNLTVNGISGGRAGRVLIITANGSNTITFNNENGSASAADRITTNSTANETIQLSSVTPSSIILVYDDTTSRWRQVTATSV